MKIALQSKGKIILSFGYFASVQGLIYSMLDRLSSNWLHEQGFKYEKRSFKLFVFSEIIEKGVVDKQTKEFVFPETVSFYFATPVEWIIEQFAKNLILKEEFYLGKNRIKLHSVEILKPVEVLKNKIKVKALSPIEAHSTLLKGDGSKKTYYYSPAEKEFSELVNLNLKKKWEAFYNEKCSHNVNVYPVNIKKCREIYVTEKETIIKGWKCHFFIEGDIPLIKFAFDTGLGSRNSLGFGMIDIV